MPSRSFKTVSFGFSTDADDAFMAYALHEGKVRIAGVQPRFRFADIEQLNEAVLRDRLDVSSISAALYPLVAKRYRILSVGASVGRGYGPVVVSRVPWTLEQLVGRRIAIPGEWTTSHLLLRCYQPDAQVEVIPAAKLLTAVARGVADAGIVIHEGQLTYQRFGLHLVEDLGRRWLDETGLPLPLGLMVAHERLGRPLARSIADGIVRGIRYTQRTWPAALSFLLPYAHGADVKTLEEFLRRYVNDDTLALPKDVKEALAVLYRRGVTARWIKSAPTIEVLTPSAGKPLPRPAVATVRRKPVAPRPASSHRKQTAPRPKRKP